MGKLVQLYPFLLLVVWWAVLRSRRRGQRWSRIGLAALGLITVLSWPPVERLSFLPLEAGYPDEVSDTDGVQAIVVLSGGMRQPDDLHQRSRLGENSYVRTRAAADRYRDLKVPVVVSGGNVRRPATVTLAAAMREQLVADGVPPEIVWLEERSTTTYENARFTARLLEEKGVDKVLVVTEAYHMPRAMACFRAQGVEAVPAPCEFRSRGRRLDWTDLLPKPRTLEEHERVFHELLGMLWYRLRGRI